MNDWSNWEFVLLHVCNVALGVSTLVLIAACVWALAMDLTQHWGSHRVHRTR